jgi:hypothetical protein
MTGRGGKKKDEARLLEVLEIDLEADREPIAVAWMPEEGEELVGMFRRWSVRTDANGQDHPVALIRDDAGQLYSVWCLHVVLKKAMHRVDPQPGDRIKIERQGDCMSAKKRIYRMYRVAILKRAGAPSEDTRSEKRASQ